MKTPVWLWIAAVITLLFGALHTLGHPWTPIQSLPAQGVVVAMREVHFPVEGMERSYLDFYEGFGWCLSALLLSLAALLGRQAATANRSVDRGLVAIECLGFIATTIAAAIYLAPLPAAFSAGVAIALAGALFSRGGRSAH